METHLRWRRQFCLILHEGGQTFGQYAEEVPGSGRGIGIGLPIETELVDDGLWGGELGGGDGGLVWLRCH